jgi:toxin ParE1/3/4
MRVELTAHAIARLRQIHAHVSADSPRNADELIERLLSRAESLGSLPLRGRRVPEYQRDDIREVQEHPYRVIYRLTSHAGSWRRRGLPSARAHPRRLKHAPGGS